VFSFFFFFSFFVKKYGRTADFYRVHVIQLPSEISKEISKSPSFVNKEASTKMKTRSSILPNIREKITCALQEGDVNRLYDLTLEGYGEGLLGRTVSGENAGII